MPIRAKVRTNTTSEEHVGLSSVALYLHETWMKDSSIENEELKLFPSSNHKPKNMFYSISLKVPALR